MITKFDDNDIELIRRLQCDDEAAFASIYKKYWKGLYTNAYAILQDRPACEDIVQEIFVNLWNKRKSIEIRVSLIAYLTSSIRYEVFRQLRNKISTLDIVDDLQISQDYSAQQNMEYKELVKHMNAVINKLSTKCQEVFILSREQQLSHKEIAVLRSISTKTVENHIGKALGSFKDNIGYTVWIYLILSYSLA